jgi:hypothetical protein
MTIATFTFVHVLLSLIGIGSGLVVLVGLSAGASPGGWTALFLVTTVATSVTGFGFPVDCLLPSHVIGFVSLAILAVTVVARYCLGRGGPWRRIYVIGAAGALYLNVFVGVVQAFLKVAALKTLAPRQTDGPFLLALGVVLVLFIGLTIQALKRFR